MEKTKIFTEECEECGKVISSLSKTQFEYNYEQHLKSHSRKKITKKDLHPSAESDEGDDLNTQYL